MHSLNVIVSRTSTKIGEMIRTVIGGKYNHCSFFLDDEIDVIYGFSRKYRDLWFTGCFTQENPLYYEEYLVYRIPLGDEEFERLSARVARMCDHVKMYDYVAAALISIDVPKESEIAQMSSQTAQYVAHLINTGVIDIAEARSILRKSNLPAFKTLPTAIPEILKKIEDAKDPEKQQGGMPGMPGMGGEMGGGMQGQGSDSQQPQELPPEVKANDEIFKNAMRDYLAKTGQDAPQQGGQDAEQPTQQNQTQEQQSQDKSKSV